MLLPCFEQNCKPKNFMDIHCSRALLCLGHYISVKFYALSSNLRERERHHEPTGAAGLDEKKPNWIQHQGAIFLHSPCAIKLFRKIRIPVPGHHLLPCKSVGHLLLIPEPGEHEKFLLWGRVFRTIQWSRWWWSRVNVDVGIFE